MRRASAVLAIVLCACAAHPRRHPGFLATFGTTRYPWPWEDLHDPHDGLDVAAHTGDGTWAIAIADGTVLSVGHPGETPDPAQVIVWIWHPKIARFVAYYHLTTSGVRVQKGEHVTRGQKLGDLYLPTTYSWVMHVHLQVCRAEYCMDGRPEDPAPYLTACLSQAGPDDVVYPIPC